MVQQTHAQQVEDAINLKRQLGVLDDVSDQDIIFQDTSPRARWDTVYSMETGEPIRVKRHRLIGTLEKRLPSGAPAFTADKARAPEYRIGTVLCFLARGSKERETVDELSLAPGFYCIAEHLANPMEARVHAAIRHPTRWKMFQEHIQTQERQGDRDRQDAQIAAVLELARRGEPEAQGQGRPRKES